MQERRLIVNADDFGFTRDVNAGIIEAHRFGIVTAATLMANGAAFDDAVRLARETPGLDVGCHLVLIGGESLAEPGRKLPATIGGLVRAVAVRSIPLYDELKSQVSRIAAAGIGPTHVDTHKHAHLLPGVLDAVVRVAREFGIHWIRRPGDLPSGYGAPWLVRAFNFGMNGVRRLLQDTIARNGCRSTDHFAGFQLTGRLETGNLVRLIEGLPPGLTEFMCHPGRCTEELRSAPTRLRASRERELAALRSEEVREALQRSNVRLVSFRDLD